MYSDEKCSRTVVINLCINLARSNLYSTVDITWRQSVEKELSPKEKMEKRKEAERKMVGERSNELIAKRLKI